MTKAGGLEAGIALVGQMDPLRRAIESMKLSCSKLKLMDRDMWEKFSNDANHSFILKNMTEHDLDIKHSEFGFGYCEKRRYRMSEWSSSLGQCVYAQLTYSGSQTWHLLLNFEVLVLTSRSVCVCACTSDCDVSSGFLSGHLQRRSSLIGNCKRGLVEKKWSL